MLNRLIQSIDKSSYRLLVKLALMISLGLLPIFGTIAAEEKSELGTIYHIYVDELHIGTVDHKDVVQQVINEKVLFGINTYEDFNVSLREDISIIPEKSFQLTYDNEEVIENLQNQLTIVAEVGAITIENEVVGYFNHEEDATEVLKAYTLKYVDEENLKEFEDKKDQHMETAKEAKELSVGDTVINDLTFSKEVSIETKEASPDEVLTLEQGIKLLEKGTLEEEVHKVSEGEVMGSIANKYDLSVKELLSLNPTLTEDSILQIGQKISVTAYQPFIDVLVTEESKVTEKIAYDVEVIESEDMYKGEEKVKQKGKNGQKEVQYFVKKQNGQVVEKEILSEEITKKPVDKVIIRGTKVIPSRGSGSLIWPAHGGYISSPQGKRWGSFHKGIDIAGPSSRDISAADHGVVESAAYHSDYGNKIIINHNNGMKTIYAHLSSFNVQVGQVVEKGTNIGVMGSTGRSTGIHLHFEVYKDGQLQNPNNYY